MPFGKGDLEKGQTKKVKQKSLSQRHLGEGVPEKNYGFEEERVALSKDDKHLLTNPDKKLPIRVIKKILKKSNFLGIFKISHLKKIMLRAKNISFLINLKASLVAVQISKNCINIFNPLENKISQPLIEIFKKYFPKIKIKEFLCKTTKKLAKLACITFIFLKSRNSSIFTNECFLNQNLLEFWTNIIKIV